MTTDGHRIIDDLRAFLDASPSPYHAVSGVVERLEAAGFAELVDGAAWSTVTGGRYVRRGGTIVAWWRSPDAATHTPLRLVGAHTDSPNLRVKPRPDTGRAGYRQLGVEVYGGVLLNSWLDRDLGLSGRVALRGAGAAPELRLVRIDEPVLRLPQLAIHLDRDVNDKGLVLDRQAHLAPIWGLGSSRSGDFAA